MEKNFLLTYERSSKSAKDGVKVNWQSIDDRFFSIYLLSVAIKQLWHQTFFPLFFKGHKSTN